MPAAKGEDAAYRFVATDILATSMRATPDTARIMCAHAPGAGGEAVERWTATAQTVGMASCPGEAAAKEQLKAADGARLRAIVREQGVWVALMLRTVADGALAQLILMSEVEDLAYHAWGPQQACFALEHCLLPML